MDIALEEPPSFRRTTLNLRGTNRSPHPFDAGRSTNIRSLAGPLTEAALAN